MNILAKQCTPLAKDCTLVPLLETPNETLFSFEIAASDIDKIIKVLENHVNKVHGDNEISQDSQDSLRLSSFANQS